MNIIIAGCGKVGSAIARQLIQEDHEITIMDTNEKSLRDLTMDIDVIGYQGDCTSIRAQIEAGVKEADLLIAVTDQDEKNMLACLIARKAGHCQTIARVRSPQYSEEIGYLKEELGLSMSINPEKVAADELLRIIQIPSAFEVDTFAKGRVSLISIKVPEGSIIADTYIKDLPSKLNMNTLICIVEHGNQVIIPDGNFKISAGDTISVTLSLSDVNAFLNRIGIRTRKMKDVLLAGGGMIAYYLAQKLIAQHINVKIIEINQKRCMELAEDLPKAMIINGDATDRKLLEEENARDMDAVCAMMTSDEANILLSHYLSNLSSVKTMTKIHRNSYNYVVDEMNLGKIISTKKITAEYITRFVRTMQNSMNSGVETLYRMMNDRVEALEFSVGDKSSVTGVTLMNMKIKPNTLICCINRKGKIIRPAGKDTIEAGDSVVVVTTNKGLKNIDDILM